MTEQNLTPDPDDAEGHILERADEAGDDTEGHIWQH